VETPPPQQAHGAKVPLRHNLGLAHPHTRERDIVQYTAAIYVFNLRGS
jgi:hypothetical protein